MVWINVNGLVRGDIILERIEGRNRMTPVRHVKRNACCGNGVHVNRRFCYENSAMVDVVDGEGSLKDLEEAVSDVQDIEEESELTDREFYEELSSILGAARRR